MARGAARGGVLAFAGVIATIAGAAGAVGSALPAVASGVSAATLVAGGLGAHRSARRGGPARSWLGWLPPGGGATVAAGVSLAIAGLGAGPRVIKPDLLTGAALVQSAGRIGLVVLGSVVLAFGIRDLLASWRGPAAASMGMRGLLPIMLVRLAPGRVGFIVVVLVIAVATMTLLVVRTPRDADPSPRSDARFFCFGFLPLLVAMLVFHHDVNGTIDFYHSGEWLSTGSEMLRGAVPFRDVYLQHGLIQNALRTFVTFSLFEPTLEFDKLSGNLLFGLSHAAFLWMGLHLFRSPLTALALALVLATDGLFLQPRLLGLFLALGCVLVHLKRSRATDGSPIASASTRWPLIGAGAASVFAAFWSLDSGVYAAGAVGLFLVVESIGRSESVAGRVRPFVLVALGGAVMAVPFVGWLAANGALGAFVQNSSRQVAYQLSVWGIPFPPLSELRDLFGEGTARALGDGRFVAIAAAVALVLSATTLVVRALGARRLTRFGYQVVLLTLAGALVYRTALGRSDPGHLAFVKALFWPLMVRVAEHVLLEMRLPRLGPTAGSLVRATPMAAVAIYFVTSFVPLYGITRQWLRLSEVRATRPGDAFALAPLPRMGTVLIPSWQARALTSLSAYMDEHLDEGETFVDFSNMGAVYFLLDRPAPSRYLFAVYAATPEMQREMIDDLERTRPPLLIVSEVLGTVQIDRVPNERRHPLLAEYLGERYRAESTEAFGTVLRRVEG